MSILAFDLGTPSSKTALAFLSSDTPDRPVQATIPTTAEALTQAVDRYQPDVIVVEATSGVGWVTDLLRSHPRRPRVLVANPRDEAWRNRTSKTDRKDAVLLAKLSLTGQLDTVVVPDASHRGWRELISTRHAWVRMRTQVKNRIRAILKRQNLHRKELWSRPGLAWLAELAQPMADVPAADMWRGLLACELAGLEQVEQVIATLEQRLDAMIEASPQATMLIKQVDGVGPRTAEALVAWIGDPLRFPNQRSVAHYFGLCPSVAQSSNSLRHGRITKTGQPIVRHLLVEVVQNAARTVPAIAARIERISRGCPQRRRQAIVGTARWLLVVTWAKLRDQAKGLPVNRQEVTAA
jgi:transposase